MAAGGYFVKKIKKCKVVYLSEMAINVIESDFRSSNMAAGGHFAKKKLKKYKSCVLIQNSEKCDRNSTKMATRLLLVWWKPFMEKLVHQ